MSKFNDASRPLYLENDALSVGLGAGQLQVRDGMNCGHDKVQDNATLHPIVLPIKAY